MKLVGINTLPHHRIRQVYPLNRKGLDEQFGYDAGAFVTPRRAILGEVLWIIDGDIEFLVEHLGQLQGKDAEEGPRWPATYNSDSGTVV